MRPVLFPLVLLAFTASAQPIALISDGQVVRKGGTTTIRCERPDSVTAMRMTVANGTVSSSFHRSVTFKDGVRTDESDSLFHWTMCDSPNTVEMAVAHSYRGGVLLAQDTTWFRVVPDSIQPILTGPSEGKGSEGPRMADEWTGIRAQEPGFFSRTEGPEVVAFQVTISKRGKVVDHFVNVGGTLSPQHRSRITRHSSGEVRIHDIVFRHSCGVQLPGRYGGRLRYAAPR